MGLALRLEGVGKRYLLRHEAAAHYETLREAIGARARRLVGRGGPRPPAREEFWALRDVTFDVAVGERLGIIGRNGAGKSTLLKLLSRITEPTAGRIGVNGRVASLLEVGTGFHPELTGRENVFLNGSVLGMRRAEIARKFDEIVAFAEIERFLDTPVKRYSSGMYVRLAFAVAAHLEPDVLVVDEVLAVGDAAFQKKCLGKIEEVGGAGRTVLFVSHNMESVRRLCDRAVLLDAGRVVAAGATGDVIDAYLGSGEGARRRILEHAAKRSAKLALEALLVGGSAEDALAVPAGATALEIEVRARVRAPTRVAVEAVLHDRAGAGVGFFGPAHFDAPAARLPEGPVTIRATVRFPPLTRGTYFLSLFLTDPGIEGLWDFPHAVRLEAASTPRATLGTEIEQRFGVGAFILGGETRYEAGGDPGGPAT